MIAAMSPTPRQICGQTSSQIPIAGDVGHQPAANGEAQEARGQHEARVDLGRQAPGDRRREKHGKARDEHGLADHPCVVAADLSEIEQVEIGQTIEADAERVGTEEWRGWGARRSG
jgi:hypothetical protein